MKKISAIIVNYNTKDILEKCIQNLLEIKKEYTELEIIVVDNASPDGAAQMVKEKFFPQVILEDLDKNGGLAVGSNVGYHRASGEYIIYLGSDAFPTAQTLFGLVDYMENPQNKKVGIATPRLVLRSGQTDMDAHRGFPTPWAALTHFSGLNKLFPKSKIFNQYFLGYKDMNQPHEIDLCIAHFMIIRREVFYEIGTWDQNFFVYGEDVDFCYRAKEAGWEIMYLPQFQAPHLKGASVGTRKETADITKASYETKVKMKQETTNAMKYFYKKHYSKKYPSFVTWFVLFGISVLSTLRLKMFILKEKSH